ncbi:MAG: hypothetical protein R3B09_06585 [Nannocystaceae bacterium]
MIPLDELKEKARIMTKDALRHYPSFPKEFEPDIALGTFFDGNLRIFELYVAKQRPQDAIILTRATLDAMTGDGKVEVFPENWVNEQQAGQ